MKELERFLLGLNSNKTKKDYNMHINSFIEFKCIQNIDDIKNLTIDDIEDWELYLRNKENSGNTRRIKLSALSSFFDYLSDRDIITKNIVKPIIRKIKVTKKETTYLTSSEVKKIQKVITNTRDYAIFNLAVNTGLRVSEIINLKLEDYKGNSLKILNTKGNKNRVVYLNQSVKEDINYYLKDRKQSKYNNLFISDRGTPMCTVSLDNTLKKLTRRAGIDKNISMHSLRRTLASGLYRNGIDIVSIKDILGHESISTTQIYIKNQDYAKEDIMLNYSYN